MRVDNMTFAQVNRLIANGYIGEHDKKGRQVDYADYKQDIDRHYWKLGNRRFYKKINDQMNDAVDVSFDKVDSFISDADFEIAWNRSFNPWRDISNRIMAVLQ